MILNNLLFFLAFEAAELDLALVEEASLDLTVMLLLLLGPFTVLVTLFAVTPATLLLLHLPLLPLGA